MSALRRPFSGTGDRGPGTGDRGLSDVLAQSRINNPRLGITGMLLYSDGNFMQAIEGDEESVDRLAETIAQDPRHCRLTRLYRGAITERQFPDWSMALRQMSDLPVEDRTGCAALMTANLGVLAPNSDRIAHKLLRSFQRSIR